MLSLQRRVCLKGKVLSIPPGMRWIEEAFASYSFPYPSLPLLSLSKPNLISLFPGY